jgi:hypothetical protein
MAGQHHRRLRVLWEPGTVTKVTVTFGVLEKRIKIGKVTVTLCFNDVDHTF